MQPGLAVARLLIRGVKRKKKTRKKKTIDYLVHCISAPLWASPRMGRAASV